MAERGPPAAHGGGSLEGARTRSPEGWLRALVAAFTLLAIGLAVNQLFNLQTFGLVVLEGAYLYLLAGLFLCLTYILLPAHAGARAVPRYDVALGAVALAVAGWFAWTAELNLEEGWE